MADYFSPTVIQPAIPAADITPLERLLLSHIFNAEPDGEGLYFYADEGPADMIWLDRAPLEAALTRSHSTAGSAANTIVARQLAQVPADNVEIELDFQRPVLGSHLSGHRCDARQACATSPPYRPLPARRCGPTASAAWRSLITPSRGDGQIDHDIIEDFLNRPSPAGAAKPDPRLSAGSNARPRDAGSFRKEREQVPAAGEPGRRRESAAAFGPDQCRHALLRSRRSPSMTITPAQARAQLRQQHFAHIHPSITAERVAQAVERELTSLDNPGFCLDLRRRSRGLRTRRRAVRMRKLRRAGRLRRRRNPHRHRLILPPSDRGPEPGPAACGPFFIVRMRGPAEGEASRKRVNPGGEERAPAGSRQPRSPEIPVMLDLASAAPAAATLPAVPAASPARQGLGPDPCRDLARAIAGPGPRARHPRAALGDGEPRSAPATPRAPGCGRTPTRRCEAAQVMFLRKFGAAMRTRAGSPAAMLEMLTRLAAAAAVADAPLGGIRAPAAILDADRARLCRRRGRRIDRRPISCSNPPPAPACWRSSPSSPKRGSRSTRSPTPAPDCSAACSATSRSPATMPSRSTTGSIPRSGRAWC